MKALIPASRLIKRQVALLLVALAPTAFAVSEIVPTNSPVLQPWSGGVNPQPTITSLTTDRAAGTLLLKWSGVHTAPYQIEKSDVVAGGKWSKVGSPTADNSASVPTSKDGNAIFRVTAGYAQYVGQGVCRGCHPTTHGEWSKTVHAGAIGTLKAIGQGSNPACLPCHTVGYGLHGGFVSEAATPALAGVQCENCHGPGGHHVGDPGDLTVRPVISLAGMVCGGCHNGFHHPTYDNWLTAGHAIVTPDVSGGFYNTNTAAADARMRSCGACHSGAVRLAML